MKDSNLSDDKAANNDSDNQQSNSSSQEVEKLKSQIADLEKKAEEYLNGWKRAKADFINFKKEQDQAFSEFVKFANESLILQILPVLDSFNLALKYLPENLKDDDWIKGVLHIKTQMDNILKDQGLEEIKTVGEKFDPLTHEIVGGDSGEDTIIEEAQKGYKLRGKVVRAAKVKVGK